MRRLIPLLCLLLSACGHEEEAASGLPRQTMVAIMVDMHLIETANNLNLIQPDSVNPSYEQLYQGIFTKYGTSQAAFDSSLQLLSQHPKQMDTLYSRVLERLSELDGEVVARNEGNLSTNSVQAGAQ